MESTLKDTIPPHDADAEQATLGALFLDWAAISNVVSLIRPEYTESLQEWLYNRITRGIESYEVTN